MTGLRAAISRLALLFLGYVPRRLLGWATWLMSTKYRVGVVGVVYDKEGCILLVKHTYRRPIQWELPGGLLNRSEKIDQAIRREVLEETGYRMGPTVVLGVDAFASPPNLDIWLAGPLVGGAFTRSAEVTEAQFFGDDLRGMVSDREWAALARHLQVQNPTGIRMPDSDGKTSVRA